MYPSLEGSGGPRSGDYAGSCVSVKQRIARQDIIKQREQDQEHYKHRMPRALQESREIDGNIMFFDSVTCKNH